MLEVGRTTAADQYLCAARCRIGDVALDLLAERVAQYRADIHALVQAVAQPQAADETGQLFGELAVAVARHIDPFGTGADLAGVEQRRVGQRAHGHVEVHVGANHHRVLAAQLQMQLLHHRRGDAGDALAGGDRSGEGDHGHVQVAHQRLAGLCAVAGDHVDDAGRQMRKGQLSQP